jgi:hypothetical protein
MLGILRIGAASGHRPTDVEKRQRVVGLLPLARRLVPNHKDLSVQGGSPSQQARRGRGIVANQLCNGAMVFANCYPCEHLTVAQPTSRATKLASLSLHRGPPQL